MTERGILVAKKRTGQGYFGDYYIFASKRSEFHYVALTEVKTFALTKSFIFKELFKKFPGLQGEMLAESFSRYLREIRRPCGDFKNKIIEKHN